MAGGDVRTVLRRPEALAALAGAVIAVIAVIAIVALEPRTPGRPAATSREHTRASRSSSGFPRSPSGAVQAATADLLALGHAAVSGGAAARRAVDAIAAVPLRTTLDGSLPRVASAIRARLHGQADSGAFDGWPLAFRVGAFGDSRAVVSLWHVDTAASPALQLVSADYLTTTYVLEWISGTWRIVRAVSVAGPTPPSTSAPAAEVDRFARTVTRFTQYRYVP
jgi:hypothetical protein